MTSTLTRIRNSDIRKALDTLNAKRGLGMREVGYSYYADIKGDGRNIRSVYTIINAGGGVTRSVMNGPTQRATLEKIKAAIAAA